MKNQLKLTLFFLLTILFVSQNSFSVNKKVIPSNTAIEKIGEVDLSAIQDMNLQDFLNMSAKEIGKKRGKKLKFKERIALGLAKRKIKKALKKGKSEEEIKEMLASGGGDFHVGGFLLGFLLGLIGVLIAYIAVKDGIKWAWIGLGIWVLLWIVLFVGVLGVL